LLAPLVRLGWGWVAGRAFSNAILLVCALATACKGQAGDSPTGTGGSVGAGGGETTGAAGRVVQPPPPGPGPQAIGSCKPELQTQVGPTPLRRISSLEYRNAVRELFGETTDVTVASGFPSDEKVGSFVSNVQTTLSATNNEGYLSAAEAVSTGFVSRFASASGCAASDAACAEKYLLQLARRAFHGTLDAQAETSLKTLHAKVGLEPGAHAGLPHRVVEIATHVADGRFSRRDQRCVHNRRAGRKGSRGPTRRTEMERSRVSEYGRWKYRLPDRRVKN